MTAIAPADNLFLAVAKDVATGLYSEAYLLAADRFSLLPMGAHSDRVMAVAHSVAQRDPATLAAEVLRVHYMHLPEPPAVTLAADVQGWIDVGGVVVEYTVHLTRCNPDVFAVLFRRLDAKAMASSLSERVAVLERRVLADGMKTDRMQAQMRIVAQVNAIQQALTRIGTIWPAADRVTADAVDLLTLWGIALTLGDAADAAARGAGERARAGLMHYAAALSADEDIKKRLSEIVAQIEILLRYAEDSLGGDLGAAEVLRLAPSAGLADKLEQYRALHGLATANDAALRILDQALNGVVGRPATAIPDVHSEE